MPLIDFTRIKTHLRNKSKDLLLDLKNGIWCDSTATVDRRVKSLNGGNNSYIYDNVFIQGRVLIGEGVNISENVVIINNDSKPVIIEDGVDIYDNVRINGHCTIKRNTLLKDNVIIEGGGSIIGEDVLLGMFTIVKKGQNIESDDILLVKEVQEERPVEKKWIKVTGK